MAYRFSVIIPTLNEEEYLPHLLKDLVTQSYKNFEVIIIDCCSSDKTDEIANEYKNKLPLKFLQIKKKNVSYQRNVGASHAVGDFLVFLDADVRIRSSFLLILEKMINKEHGLLFIPHVDPEYKDPQLDFVFPLINYLSEVSQIFPKPFSSSGGSLIVERNFFLRIGGFSENVIHSEDHLFISKARSWGVRGKFSDRLRLKFSLRRFKREGSIRMLYKSLFMSAQYLLKNKIDRKIVEYEMGGHLYTRKQKMIGGDEFVRKYLSQLRNFLKEFLTT